jgi:hypothetical protein
VRRAPIDASASVHGRFDHRVVDRAGDAAHGSEQSGFAEAVPEDPADYCAPRSEWTIAPGGGRRRQFGRLRERRSHAVGLPIGHGSEDSNLGVRRMTSPLARRAKAQGVRAVSP